MSVVPEAISPPAPEAPMSPWERAIAVFARPASAWRGLQHQVQWFWPLILTTVINVSMVAIMYDRVIVPSQLERLDQQIESGQIPADQADRIEAQMTSTTARWIGVSTQLLAIPIMYCMMAAVVWFGCGFVLGTRFRYRHALEVIGWAGLVNLPALAITWGLAWSKQSFEGVHLGLAALLPESDSPSKLMTALRIFLDQIGPFQIWYVVVAVLGAAALSGAARKNVAWVLVSLYLALALFFSAVGAVFAPGA